MTKSEYLSRLAAALKSVEKAERDRFIAYYSELIDDRMEEGYSEENAVAMLESVEAAAQRILAEVREQGKIKKGLGAGAVVAIVLGSVLLFFLLLFIPFRLFTGFNISSVFTSFGRVNLSGIETIIPEISGELEFCEASFLEDTRSFELLLIVSHIEVKPSDDGEFHLTYYSGEDHPLQLSKSAGGGSVVLEDTRNNRYTDIEISNLFPGKSAKTPEYTVTLFVPDGASVRLDLVTVSGSVALNSVGLADDLNIATVSGDITLDSLECRNFDLATVSGNTDINLLTSDSIEAAVTSGKLELGSVTTGKINAANVSGDVIIYNTSFESLYCNTVAGNLDGMLQGEPSDYRLDFASLSGHNSLKGITGSGEIFIEFASVSGNLNLEFE